MTFWKRFALALLVYFISYAAGLAQGHDHSQAQQGGILRWSH